ncbi:hypothetical protein [Methylobacterium aquaticum]|uniref:Uncharacterized protein n=1 Tax=Methylobacterium aquaticum TaxID=270351 RepID=A0A0C6G2I2_9HYPH|nr:hypothetical protein [Methylobacterium aquaticum]BAQ50325.1 hypothetical protein Maq22A_3p50375 [Methylobacterium aquaticum]
MADLTDRQRAALKWVLECQLEITAAKAPKYNGDQAAEEILDLAALAELTGDKALIRSCTELHREHAENPIRVLRKLVGMIEHCWSDNEILQIGDLDPLDAAREMLAKADEWTCLPTKDATQMAADTVELDRIRTWARDQEEKMNAEPDARPPDGDDWNDLHAQVMP